MTQHPPPGWYQADNDQPGTERYWDGNQWSAQTRAAQAAAPWMAPQPSGQIGRPRSAGLTLLVTVVTLGLWTLPWSYLNGEELRAYRGTGMGGIGHLIITLIFAPVTMFLMAGEVEQLYKEAGLRPRITSMAGFWFLLPLIGNLVWYLQIQGAINDFWQARGGSRNPGLV